MATSKQSFWRASEHQCAASSQCEEEVQSKARLTAMFVGTIPAAGPPQTCPSGLPGQRQETAILPLVFPGIFGESALPSLMLHITSSAALHQPRPGTPLLSPRTKSLGRHVCPHCGKDCLKPSVLEKHLRCHTGERPYPCTTCGISFKTQSNLYKHKRTQAHARHSSESDKGSLSSQESSGSAGDPCPIGVPAERKTVLELGLHNAVVVGCSITPAIQDEVTALSSSTSAGSQQTSVLRGHEIHMTSIRTPLTRQEALFSKPSGSPLSHRKSQNHDSTDSGFSEGSEHHSSSIQRDPSRSLPEASMERENESLPEDTLQDPKSTVSVQEKQTLEERISKLIYENSMLVEDKRLENVRPRKTVLSKQGSIDLPVPYTYKDSFHFEMRSSKHVPCPLKPDRRGAQCSLPTQHAPLTRSSSLPFTMGVRVCDGAVSPSLSRRCSAGHVNPLHSPDRPVANHPSLVRQVAIDCQHGTEGSLVKKSSVSSLSSEGDGLDAGAETSPKVSYRKKTRRFDYTKWHTYKCGSFQKLYRTDSKDGLVKSRGTSSEKPESHAQTEEASLNVNPQHDPRGFKNNVQYQTPKSANNNSERLTTSHGNIPPERKKICTEKEVIIPHITNPTHGSAEITTCSLLASTLSSACATNLSTMTNVQNLGSYSGFVPQLSSPPAVCLMEMTGTSVTPSVPVSSSNVHEAKTSFPPKYQLKIRCSTDRTSTSFSGSSLDLKNGPETSKQDHFSKILKLPKLLEGDSYVSHERNISQKDVQQRAKSLSDTLPTALHSTTTITALSSQHHEVLLQNQDSRDVEPIQSTPAVLPPSTEAFSISETRQPVQNDSSASVEVIPSSSVLVPAYSRICDVQLTGTITTSQSQSCESQATPSGKQSSILESSSVSQTQNTFYVQTPDLQIVMQLISDEQLAMIEPHIDFNSTDGDSVIPGVPSNQPEPAAGDIQVNIRSEATAFSLEQTSAESSKITLLQYKSSPSLRTTDPEVPNQTSFAMTDTESADSEMVRTKISLFNRNTSSGFSAEAQHVSFSSVNAVPVMTRSAAVEDPSEIVFDTYGFSRHDTGEKKTLSFLSCSADDRKNRDEVKTWCGTISQSSNILVPKEAGCKDAPDFPTRANTETRTGGLSSSQESVPEEAGSGRDRRPRSDTAEMSNTCENKSQVRTSGEEVQPADNFNTSLSVSKAAQLLDVRASNHSEGQKLKKFDRTDKAETSSPSTCAAQAGHHLLIHPHLVSALHKGSQTTSCFLHPKPQTFLGELRMSVVGRSTSASSLELMSSSSSSLRAVPCSGHDLVPQREDDSSSDDERKLVIELE